MLSGGFFCGIWGHPAESIVNQGRKMPVISKCTVENVMPNR